MRLRSKSLKSEASGATRKRKRHLLRRRNPLRQFRAVIRKIQSNIYWISDTTHWELGTNVERNMYILQHRRKRLLSLEDKICLRKPTEERTAEEINVMMKKLRMFKAFKHYPEDVKRNLLFHAGFECWNKDRVIVRQGHWPGYAYFIVAGTANLDFAFPNPLFANEVIHEVDKLREGDGFGEMAILYNEPHLGTVTVTSEWIEVLLLPKDLFISLLEETVKKNREAVRWAFMKFPHFDKFPHTAIRHLCSYSSLVTYPPNEIIPTKNEYDAEIVTMIVDGTCKVLQTLFISEDKTKPTYKRFNLYSKNTTEDWTRLPDNVRPVIMQICTLRRKCIFGLGEKMSKNTIVADTEVLALVVPRYLLLRYNITNVWDRVIGTLDLTYPKIEEIFHSFIENRRWNTYKTKLKKEINNKLSRPLEMCIHDAPLTTRARTLRLRGQLYDKVVSMPYYKFGELNIEDIMEMVRAKRTSFEKSQLTKDKSEKQRFEQEYLKLKSLYVETQKGKPNF